MAPLLGELQFCGNLFLNAALKKVAILMLVLAAPVFCISQLYLLCAESTEPDFDIISTPYTPVGARLDRLRVQLCTRKDHRNRPHQTYRRLLYLPPLFAL